MKETKAYFESDGYWKATLQKDDNFTGYDNLKTGNVYLVDKNNVNIKVIQTVIIVAEEEEKYKMLWVLHLLDDKKFVPIDNFAVTRDTWDNYIENKKIKCLHSVAE
ncbi:hypothetical protein BpsS140_00011 [Bacillus phage vB_BpsS-140]|nr:hypothetical protein BpsS140_00011 [Bacillus phage vB_BpsS-140]